MPHVWPNIKNSPSVVPFYIEGKIYYFQDWGGQYEGCASTWWDRRLGNRALGSTKTLLCSSFLGTPYYNPLPKKHNEPKKGTT